MLCKTIYGVEHRPVYVPDMKHGIVRAWVSAAYLQEQISHRGPTGPVFGVSTHRAFGSLYLGVNCALTVEVAILLGEALRTKRLAELKQETEALQNLVFLAPDPFGPLPDEFTPPTD